jgi:DNA-directed RNA polymerase sigma subunit (sigma70/sigma32)
VQAVSLLPPAGARAATFSPAPERQDRLIARRLLQGRATLVVWSTTPRTSFRRKRCGSFLAEVERHRVLTATQTVILAKRVERGDMVAKKELVDRNLRLVVAIATR